MALRRGFSYNQIDGNPLLAIQAGSMDPLTRAGETSGQVFCPQRRSHIAVMRCGEYQDRFGCGRGAIHRAPCPNAASEKLIEEKRTQARSSEERQLYECPLCHEPVKNAGSRCQSCANAFNRGLRASRNHNPFRGRPPRKQAKPSPVCIACGNPKKSYVGTRCKSCASGDPARHHPHKTRHNERFYRGVF